MTVKTATGRAAIQNTGNTEAVFRLVLKSWFVALGTTLPVALPPVVSASLTLAPDATSPVQTLSKALNLLGGDVFTAQMFLERIMPSPNADVAHTAQASSAVTIVTGGALVAPAITVARLARMRQGAGGRVVSGSLRIS